MGTISCCEQYAIEMLAQTSAECTRTPWHMKQACSQPFNLDTYEMKANPGRLSSETTTRHSSCAIHLRPFWCRTAADWRGYSSPFPAQCVWQDRYHIVHVPYGHAVLCQTKPILPNCFRACRPATVFCPILDFGAANERRCNGCCVHAHRQHSGIRLQRQLEGERLD